MHGPPKVDGHELHNQVLSRVLDRLSLHTWMQKAAPPPWLRSLQAGQRLAPQCQNAGRLAALRIYLSHQVQQVWHPAYTFQLRQARFRVLEVMAVGPGQAVHMLVCVGGDGSAWEDSMLRLGDPQVSEHR